MASEATDVAEILTAFTSLLKFFVDAFGPRWTIAMFIAVPVLSFLWRLYNDWRKDKEVHAALAEKDRTIQRLAKSERELRILFFKEKANWTDEQVERFVMDGEFEDGPHARKSLEGRAARRATATGDGNGASGESAPSAASPEVKRNGVTP